jgi:hypothetical protein
MKQIKLINMELFSDLSDAIEKAFKALKANCQPTQKNKR